MKRGGGNPPRIWKDEKAIDLILGNNLVKKTFKGGYERSKKRGRGLY